MREILTLYQNIPFRIDPIAFSIGSFSVRWYAVSYILGFVVVYLVLLWRIKHDNFKQIAQIFNFQFSIFKQKEGSSIFDKKTESIVRSQMSNVAFDLLLIAFFSALMGGRIGYVLFYDWAYFVAHPLTVISPYNQEGFFIGIFGMSYHGALVGIIIGCFIFLRIKKQNFLAWADFMVAGVALGYFFGRIGNFLNGELYGRITNSPLGMYFTADPYHLRHPSQLYEAVLEGLLLFLILWNIRNKKMPTGSFFAMYIFGYGLMRVISEQFREPDLQVGFLWHYFTLGQALSLVMMMVGLAAFFSLSKKRN